MRQVIIPDTKILANKTNNLLKLPWITRMPTKENYKKSKKTKLIDGINFLKKFSCLIWMLNLIKIFLRNKLIALILPRMIKMIFNKKPFNFLKNSKNKVSKINRSLKNKKTFNRFPTILNKVNKGSLKKIKKSRNQYKNKNN
jgi:hypothetical protein